MSRAKLERFHRQNGKGTHSWAPLLSSSCARRSRVELAGVKICEPRGLAGRRVEGVVNTCCVGGKIVTTCLPEESH